MPPSTKIYVLDDDEVIRTVLTALFEDHYESVLVTDECELVSQALLAARESDALLICDLWMPGVNGEDFLVTLLKNCPRVRVILYSGSSDVGICARRLGRGVLGIEKGGSPQVLIAAAAALLGSVGTTS